MGRAIVAAFLVAAGAAAAVILIGRDAGHSADMRGALLVAAPILLFGGPIVLGVVAAWLVPGAWPDRERPLGASASGSRSSSPPSAGLLLGGIRRAVCRLRDAVCSSSATSPRGAKLATSPMGLPAFGTTSR